MRTTLAKWGGAAKKLAVGVAATAIAVGLVPAMAFATDSTGEYYVDLPKADEVISFQHV